MQEFHLEDRKVKSTASQIFVTLLHRTTLDQIRDKEFKAKCLQHLITALIIGLIFHRNPWNEKINPYLQKERLHNY